MVYFTETLTVLLFISIPIFVLSIYVFARLQKSKKETKIAYEKNAVENDANTELILKNKGKRNKRISVIFIIITLIFLCIDIFCITYLSFKSRSERNAKACEDFVDKYAAENAIADKLNLLADQKLKYLADDYEMDLGDAKARNSSYYYIYDIWEFYSDIRNNNDYTEFTVFKDISFRDYGDRYDGECIFICRCYKADGRIEIMNTTIPDDEDDFEHRDIYHSSSNSGYDYDYNKSFQDNVGSYMDKYGY